MEFGDDGIVPSTPTLFIPKTRGDGFAEVISSPQVLAPFFGASTSQPASAQPQHEQAQARDDVPALASQQNLDNPFLDFAMLAEGANTSGMPAQSVSSSIFGKSPSEYKVFV